LQDGFVFDLAELFKCQVALIMGCAGLEQQTSQE
jgi:hypothetical protein